MTPPPRRYTSPDEDSARWAGFGFRDGDIVVSARSKSGTTWVQMICALLVFGAAELPRPLAELSPWMDHCVEPVADVHARLAAQRHRRFIKTHTPLDGVPDDPRAAYVVVCRHPLDLAVSLYHQGDNIDRARLAELTGSPVAAGASRPPLHHWLVAWTAEETTASEQLDSLVGVLHHAADAWGRRDDPRVVLVHYADLSKDLEGEMRRLANRLACDVPRGAWPSLVEAAGFSRMRWDSERLAPDRMGILKDASRFFRGGRCGDGRAVLSAQELRTYEARVAGLAAPDLVAWLHR